MQITSGLPEKFNPDAYDMIVVGAGYAGAVCARRLAENAGFHVAVLERRDHIAGNAYDYLDENGILVHKYGPHIYHTFNERVHNFLSRFARVGRTISTRSSHNIHGTLMPVPFNHVRALKLAFGEERGEQLFNKLVDTLAATSRFPSWSCARRATPTSPRLLTTCSRNLLHYTMKQWGQTPDQIDPSITGRVPVFIGDDDRYFPQAPYQGMPADGYTPLFEHMLDHDLIDVYCDVDARDIFEIGDTIVRVCGKVYGGEIVYTGPLDELFGLDLGALPYRTLDMKFETLDMDQFQPVGTVNYTTARLHAYHRVQEHDRSGCSRQRPSS